MSSIQFIAARMEIAILNSPESIWCNRRCNYYANQFPRNKMGKCNPISLNGRNSRFVEEPRKPRFENNPSPDRPFLAFLEKKTRKTTQKTRIFLYAEAAEPLKSPGKERKKHSKKARQFLARKKKAGKSPKKTRKTRASQTAIALCRKSAP